MTYKRKKTSAPWFWVPYL